MLLFLLGGARSGDDQAAATVFAIAPIRNGMRFIEDHSRCQLASRGVRLTVGTILHPKEALLRRGASLERFAPSDCQPDAASFGISTFWDMSVAPIGPGVQLLKWDKSTISCVDEQHIEHGCKQVITYDRFNAVPPGSAFLAFDATIGTGFELPVGQAGLENGVQ